MNQQSKFFDCFPELDQEFFLVGRTTENSIAALAPGDDMINGAIGDGLQKGKKLT